MKILVISLAGIGDTILATPLIHELRSNFREATIETVVMWAGARDLLETNPHLDQVHFKNLMKCGKREALEYLNKLRQRRFDVSINTHPQSRVHYRLTAAFLGAQERYSHAYECIGFWDAWLMTRCIPQDYSVHTVENNLRFLKLLGASKQLPRHVLEVFLKPEEEAWAEEFTRSVGFEGRPWIGVHMGSGGTKNLTLKRWSLERYRELFHEIRTAWPDLGILLFGGPEEEAEIQSVIQEHDEKMVVRARTPNLRSAGALMRRGAAFLSVDTALMHLAAAVRAKGQVVIEAPTLNTTNLPFENPFTLVQNPVVNGRPLDFYRYDGRGIQGTREELLRCMESITPEMVMAGLGKALGRR